MVSRYSLFGLFFLIALILALAKPHYAQTVASQAAQDEGAAHAQRSLAVNLLRAINTAEYQYKFKHGSFADRQTLLASDEFRGRAMKWAAQNDPKVEGTALSAGPKVLPGWALRLNLINAGAGYDVQLEDLTDKSCGYAASSDERAVIRQSKTIDCDL